MQTFGASSVKAAAIAVALLAAIVAVRAGPMSVQSILTACHGFQFALEKIEIDQCPDAAKVGYCEIKNVPGSFINLNLTFTPCKCKPQFGESFSNYFIT